MCTLLCNATAERIGTRPVLVTTLVVLVYKNRPRDTPAWAGRRLGSSCIWDSTCRFAGRVGGAPSGMRNEGPLLTHAGDWPHPFLLCTGHGLDSGKAEEYRRKGRRFGSSHGQRRLAAGGGDDQGGPRASHHQSVALSWCINGRISMMIDGSAQNLESRPPTNRRIRSSAGLVGNNSGRFILPPALWPGDSYDHLRRHGSMASTSSEIVALLL